MSLSNRTSWSISLFRRRSGQTLKPCPGILIDSACVDCGEPGLGQHPFGIEQFELPEFTFAITRSEEHTSELQSLMRISSAVFCLKKKKQENIYNIADHH